MDNLETLSISGYIHLLESLLKAGYQFLKFQDDPNSLRLAQHVYLRHDADFSIRGVKQISQLEYELGIQSTYFFHQRSPLYNVFSAYSIEVITEINQKGHDVALHFDRGFYQDSFQENLLNELYIFKQVFPFCNSSVVSFHRVGKGAIDLSDILMPPGIIHTYQKQFFQDIAYFSDSGGAWRRGNPLASTVYQEKKSMQILTHPMWWTEPGEDPFQKLNSYLKNNREQTIDFLESTVISYSLSKIRNTEI